MKQKNTTELLNELENTKSILAFITQNDTELKVFTLQVYLQYLLNGVNAWNGK